jgi:CheY-like chemotaxis protein
MDKKVLSGKTILIVKSNAFDASSLATLLEGAGAAVVVAARRADAVAIAANGQIFAAVLDPQQHELSGDALTRVLRDRCVPHFACNGRLPIAKSAWASALPAPRLVTEDILSRVVKLCTAGAEDAPTFTSGE